MRGNRERRPTLEALERREAPAAGLPGVGVGAVPRPFATGEVAANIASENLAAHRRATIIAFAARPLAGSQLLPRVEQAKGALGTRLPFRAGSPYLPGRINRALGFARASQAGSVTGGISGSLGSTGSFGLETYLPGDVNGDGTVDLQDTEAFAEAFGIRAGDPGYLPSADANRNGQIGQGDARLILRNLTPITPRIPLNLSIQIAPGDLDRYPTVNNDPSGITRKRDITIVGRTTPGSLIFLDGPDPTARPGAAADYKFEERAFAADAQGYFSFPLHLDSALTNSEYLVIDPFGQQIIKALPIRLVR